MARLCSDSSQRSLSNRRTYCAMPMKLSDGKVREAVNDVRKVHSAPPIYAPSTTSAIGNRAKWGAKRVWRRWASMASVLEGVGDAALDFVDLDVHIPVGGQDVLHGAVLVRRQVDL